MSAIRIKNNASTVANRDPTRLASESLAAPTVAAPQPKKPIKLILFGDSWVRDDFMTTWPELLGEHLGWPTINVALPGSHSGMLKTQADLLAYALERTGRTIDDDAWALVHTGGNDLLQNHPTDMLKLIGRLLCCGCLPGVCTSDEEPALEPQLHNTTALVGTLRDTFGVRNVMLVSLPLTIHMPLVSRYLQLLLGSNSCIDHLGGVVVRRLNRLYLRRLERDARRLTGVTAIALDEAGAIETLIADAAAAAAKRELYGDGGPEGELELHEVGANGIAMSSGRAHELLHSPDDLWRDMMHPSQRMHAALSFSLLETFRAQSGLEAPSNGQPLPLLHSREHYAPPRAQQHIRRGDHGGGGSDGEGEGVPLC